MTRPCPFCASPNSEQSFPYATRWSGRTFEYFRCAECGCVFVDPIPSDAEFAKMYAPEAYHAVHYADSSEARHDDSLRFLEAHCANLPGAALLDFGCGAGTFMRAGRRTGLEVFGIEHTADAAAKLRDTTGLDIQTLDQRLADARRFDVIHLGDVLEHLPFPLDTMRSLATLLTPKGHFFVEGPLQAHASVVFGVASAVARFRRRIGTPPIATQAPTHLILATASSQRRFFTDAMGHRVEAFVVYEDGWPYLHRGPAGRSAGALARRAIGHAATLAAAAPGLRGRIGNRFMALTTAREP